MQTPQTAWIEDVLEDIKTFALTNEMAALAASLDSPIAIAKDLEQRRSVFTTPGLHGRA